MRRISVLMVIIASLGCGGEDVAGYGLTTTYEPALVNTLLDRFTKSEFMPVEGNWPDDYGDGNYYGPAFMLRYGLAANNSKLVDIGEDNLVYNNAIVQKGFDKISVLLGQMEEVLMAGFGMIEGERHQPNDDQRKRLYDLIDLLDNLAKGFGYYIPDEAFSGGFAASTYGPTSLNGILAAMNFEAALQLGGENKEKWIATGKEILAAGRAKAYDEKLGYYIFSETRTGHFLYPNIAQMLGNLRAYQLTDDNAYLEHAESLYDAIEPLSLEGKSWYRSPYSAEEMGAKTDEYTTLSSQNYAMLALTVAYGVTKKQKYKDRALKILEFVRADLLEGDRILHHWIDGKIASPTDKYVYCSGCNLQVLYVIWQMETLLAN
jgi:hypothetical protein